MLKQQHNCSGTNTEGIIVATVDSKETISRKQYNVLDLFCGCGGMSWGLAKKGFQIVAGLDIWDIALKTYQYNHKHAKAVNLDLSLIHI